VVGNLILGFFWIQKILRKEKKKQTCKKKKKKKTKNISIMKIKGMGKLYYFPMSFRVLLIIRHSSKFGFYKAGFQNNQIKWDK
jgi:hypothetical protein